MLEDISNYNMAHVGLVYLKSDIVHQDYFETEYLQISRDNLISPVLTINVLCSEAKRRICW